MEIFKRISDSSKDFLVKTGGGDPTLVRNFSPQSHAFFYGAGMLICLISLVGGVTATIVGNMAWKYSPEIVPEILRGSFKYVAILFGIGYAIVIYWLDRFLVSSTDSLFFTHKKLNNYLSERNLTDIKQTAGPTIKFYLVPIISAILRIALAYFLAHQMTNFLGIAISQNDMIGKLKNEYIEQRVAKIVEKADELKDEIDLVTEQVTDDINTLEVPTFSPTPTPSSDSATNIANNAKNVSAAIKINDQITAASQKLQTLNSACKGAIGEPLALCISKVNSQQNLLNTLNSAAKGIASNGTIINTAINLNALTDSLNERKNNLDKAVFEAHIERINTGILKLVELNKKYHDLVIYDEKNISDEYTNCDSAPSITPAIAPPTTPQTTPPTAPTTRTTPPSTTANPIANSNAQIVTCARKNDGLFRLFSAFEQLKTDPKYSAGALSWERVAWIFMILELVPLLSKLLRDDARYFSAQTLVAKRKFARSSIEDKRNYNYNEIIKKYERSFELMKRMWLEKADWLRDKLHKVVDYRSDALIKKKSANIYREKVKKEMDDHVKNNGKTDILSGAALVNNLEYISGHEDAIRPAPLFSGVAKNDLAAQLMDGNVWHGLAAGTVFAIGSYIAQLLLTGKPGQYVLANTNFLMYSMLFFIFGFLLVYIGSNKVLPERARQAFPLLIALAVLGVIVAILYFAVDAFQAQGVINKKSVLGEIFAKANVEKSASYLIWIGLAGFVILAQFVYKKFVVGLGKFFQRNQSNDE